MADFQSTGLNFRNGPALAAMAALGGSASQPVVGCLNGECCESLKAYLHAKGRYLYVLAALALIFGVAAVFAAFYQRHQIKEAFQRLSLGQTEGSTYNHERYFFIAMTVVTIISIIALPVTVAVSDPLAVAPVYENNAEPLMLILQDPSTGCGAVNDINYHPTQCPNPCRVNATITAYRAKARLNPQNTELSRLIVEDLPELPGTVRSDRYKISGILSDVRGALRNLLFCPYCINTTNGLQVDFISHQGGSPATYFNDILVYSRNKTLVSGTVRLYVENANPPPVANANVTVSFYGTDCSELTQFKTDANGQYSGYITMPADNAIYSVTFTFSAPGFRSESVTATLGGALLTSNYAVQTVFLFPAVVVPVGSTTICDNNGGCDPLTVCVPITTTSRFCSGCPNGFSGTGETGCVNINECATNNGGCDTQTTCSDLTPSAANNWAGFSCSQCPAGYVGNGGSPCVDVNECATTNGGCGANRICVNNAGSRTCGGCMLGFTDQGGNCVDIDECAAPVSPCSNSQCVNTAGSFYCGTCSPGYFGSGATACIDINECASNNGGCSIHPASVCTNTPGSRVCNGCPNGYFGDGLFSFLLLFLLVSLCLLHSSG
jgi:hypothetical protein